MLLSNKVTQNTAAAGFNLIKPCYKDVYNENNKCSNSDGMEEKQIRIKYEKGVRL